MLSRTPNLFFYSDAGNGLNYNHIKNDIESGDIYWIDYPDILSSASYIQVQRGTGYAPYGISVIGGVINVVGFKFSEIPKTSIFGGYGSYKTFRFTSYSWI